MFSSFGENDIPPLVNNTWGGGNLSLQKKEIQDNVEYIIVRMKLLLTFIGPSFLGHAAKNML